MQQAETKTARIDTTESDKMHLVMVCADELAPLYGVEPQELWGAGWEGIKQAEELWEPSGPFLAFARFKVIGCMKNSFRVGRFRGAFLTI